MNITKGFQKEVVTKLAGLLKTYPSAEFLADQVK